MRPEFQVKRDGSEGYQLYELSRCAPSYSNYGDLNNLFKIFCYLNGIIENDRFSFTTFDKDGQMSFT